MERKTAMKYYKLLTQDLKSHNNTQWQIGVPITIQKEGVEMCTDQVLHCYNHPFLAVLLNPIHANISNPKLFEIEVDQIVANDGLKFASKSQTLIGEIPLPQINTEQRIEFAIKVAKLVCKDSKWNLWADSWLDSSDRSKKSARAASASASASADRAASAATAWAATAWAATAWAATAWAATAWAAAAWAAAADADWAAWAAARAAYAARAARAAYTTNAADAADKNEFNQKMIDIIGEIVNVKA